MTLPTRPSVPGISGDRFRVHYRLAGTEAEARELADVIRVEQTVEIPADLVPDGDISDYLVGKVEAFEPIDEGHYAVTINYAIEVAGTELPQLLNILWGTGSFLNGFKVEGVDLPDSLLKYYRGPRFGPQGWREILKVYDRPLLCTAIKPMGLSAEQLADMAYKCALGGLDIIKDDHGITDLPFCSFEERVESCSEAVAKANRETGLNCLYVANVTGKVDRMVDRALFAKQAGAGALLINTAVVGFDMMRLLADDDRIALPIISHPAFAGHYVMNPDHAFSYYLYFGQLQRLAGADSSIFINYGGRFKVAREDTEGARDGCRVPMGPIKQAMPMAGGGITFPRIPELREIYDKEAIFLVGGGLHRHSDDLTENVREFLRLVS